MANGKVGATRCISAYAPTGFADFLKDEANARGVSLSRFLLDTMSVSYYESGDDRIPLIARVEDENGRSSVKQQTDYMKSLGASDDFIEKSLRQQKEDED